MHLRVNMKSQQRERFTNLGSRVRRLCLDQRERKTCLSLSDSCLCYMERPSSWIWLKSSEARFLISMSVILDLFINLSTCLFEVASRGKISFILHVR